MFEMLGEPENPAYFELKWEGRPPWALCQFVCAGVWGCENDDCDHTVCVEEDSVVVHALGLARTRVGMLAEPPEGHMYLLVVDREAGMWKVEVTDVYPHSPVPLANVRAEMLKAGKKEARRAGFASTPEVRLLEVLGRIQQLRELNAPELILASEKKLAQKYMRAFFK